MDVKCKRLSRMLAMLRGHTAALRIETGRWNGVKREERICRQCTMGEIEDEEHFLLRCEDLKQEREAVVDGMMELESEFPKASNEKKVVLTLDQACRNVNVGKSIKKLWQRRFNHQD